MSSDKAAAESALIEALRSLGDTDASVLSLDEESTDPDPGFTGAVLHRIRGLPAPRTLRRRQMRRRIAAGVMAAALAVVPGPRSALARFLGIGSVRIEQTSRPAGASLPKSILDLELGARSTLADASSLLGHPVAVIRGREPAGVWVQTIDATRPGVVMVNTVYVTGRQTVLVSELPTTGNVYLNQKFLGPDAKMEFVTIKRRPAAWLYGAPHVVVVQRPSGDVATLPVRLAGNVLLWADDTRTIRIEGLNDRAAAIAILGRLI